MVHIMSCSSKAENDQLRRRLASADATFAQQTDVLKTKSAETIASVKRV